MQPPPWRRLARFLGRPAQILLVAWASATLAFLTLQLTPGDAIEVLLINAPEVTEADRQAIREYYGLDRPWPLQYLGYIGNLLQGDLGWSYRQQRPVAEILSEAVWPTLKVATLAIVMAAGLTFLASLIASSAGTWRSRILGAIEITLIAVPAFWLGVALLTVFSFWLGWFPSAGDKGLATLVLPAATLALAAGARVARVFRRSAEAAEREPFVLSARARGLSARAIRRRHTSRHALIGTITLGGSAFAELLTGAVLVEAIFSRPGLGRELAAAVVSKDIPVVMALVVLAGITFAVINMLVDASYRRIDPRVAG